MNREWTEQIPSEKTNDSPIRVGDYILLEEGVEDEANGFYLQFLKEKMKRPQEVWKIFRYGEKQYTEYSIVTKMGDTYGFDPKVFRKATKEEIKEEKLKQLFEPVEPRF